MSQYWWHLNLSPHGTGLKSAHLPGAWPRRGGAPIHESRIEGAGVPIGDVLSSARWYLTNGRLLVRETGAGRVTATCRGSRATYGLGFSPSRGWWCDCTARGDCAHLIALYLVTRRPASSLSAVASPRG